MNHIWLGLEVYQKRQIEGALCRVPRDFYNKVWAVLLRLPGGLLVSGQHLGSSLGRKSSKTYEFNFVVFVESLLGRISSPQYRQINVELLTVIHLILERNPELSFPASDPVDLDKVSLTVLEQDIVSNCRLSR